ncbi:ion transporter [Mycoplasma zalophidermidis]|uniref:Ion transporter n=1 Tax=Mycoplasma zalophidermidis TaxID=398174 RepID=A0ABS6DR80_9MOLU|nr:ion transporter [Mycoplasma zalophidermidis]MBU4693508.1 ion transporter [Mycoplasma zalophidermidis]
MTETNKTNKTWFNIIKVIATSSKDLSNIDNKFHWITKLLRNVYMSIIFVVYLASILTLTIRYSSISENNWIKALLGINHILVIVIAFIDFIMWGIISFEGKRPWLNLLKYPFTFMGILLILILIPSVNELIITFSGKGTKLYFLRYFVFVRIIRVFMLLSLFSPFAALFRVFKKEKYVLIYTFIFMLFVIIIFSLIFYSEEYNTTTKIFMQKEGQTVPDGNQFIKAIYFTTVTMTTIGYGDLTPATEIGRVMVIVLSIIGIAIFAIPSGVIAGGFISELKSQISERKKENSNE